MATYPAISRFGQFIVLAFSSQNSPCAAINFCNNLFQFFSSTEREKVIIIHKRVCELAGLVSMVF